jgi:predicted GNAT family N-acyltransferase
MSANKEPIETTFQEFDVYCPEYIRSIALRDVVLRKPYGIALSEKLPIPERDYRHFGLFLPDGKIVATVMAAPTESSTVRIRQMAVDESFQHRGLGRTLLIKAENALFESGTRKYVLHARDHAVGFYTALGYNKSGDPFDEVGIVHWQMVKISGEE